MSAVTGAGVHAQTLPRAASRAASGLREHPGRLVLGVRDGVIPCDKPPVRIFLGTEPAQYRAERIFVWSIDRVRDPARVYEIYLMKDLAGFNRAYWLTGFTNYRFAIPYFAGGAGRAIYNDVDQIYLGDPAELFDMPMGDHGVLAIAPAGRLDTSVMLFDCARMSPVWTVEEARRKRKNTLIRKAKAAGMFGTLAPSWNARDEEHAAGESRLLHYTTLHKQPWRPFPGRFVYQRNPVADVWLDLEASADKAGFQVSSFARPSPGVLAQAERLRRDGVDETATWTGAGETKAALDDLIERTQAGHVLDFCLGAPAAGAPLAKDRPGLAVTRFDPALGPWSDVSASAFDGVVNMNGLQCLADGDVIWVVEELFRRARRFVHVRVPNYARPRDAAPDGKRAKSEPRDAFWWFARFEACGARYPDVRWRLELGEPQGDARHGPLVREGGPLLEGAPKVWILDDGKPGHTTQSVGLAEALGWPYEVKTLRFNLLAGLGNLLLGPRGATQLGVDHAKSDPLGPPWPDLLIATGWRPAPTARWVGAQGRGRTRTVQMGRKGGRVAELYDIVVSCGYFRLPFHPRRIETSAPLNRVSRARLAEAAAHWDGLFGDAPAPHVVALVGGSSRRHRMTAEAARRMGEALRGFVAEAGGSVFAVTSRRTGAAATAALAKGLGSAGRIVGWDAGQRENPYLGYLALADVLVVTGESESMLSEAAATGKPIYIYPVDERGPGPWGRIEDWVSARAHARRLNRRGTTRPQRGVDHLCARLIARGIVQPRRDVNLLHEKLLELGIARPFGTPLDTWKTTPLHEADAVAARVRALLGLP